MRWSTSLCVCFSVFHNNRSLYSKHLIHPINIFIKILRCRTQQGFHLIRFLWTKQGWKDAKARTPVRQWPLLLGLLGLFFHCFPSHSHLSILSAESYGNLQCELCRMRIQYSKNGRWMIQWLTKENVCSMASVYSPTWLPLQIQKSWTYCHPGTISHSQQLLTPTRVVQTIQANLFFGVARPPKDNVMKRMLARQLCDTTTLDFSAKRQIWRWISCGPPGVFPKNWPDSCSATVGPHDQLASAHHGDHGNLANWVPPSTATGHGASGAFPLETPGANLQYLGIGWDWWRWFRCQVQPKSTSTGEVGEKKVWALCNKFWLRNFKRNNLQHWPFALQAQAKELDPRWFHQHCEQRGVDRHREQNRSNQHLKELVNFNRFDSRIPGPNSSKDLNCHSHRCHELIWNLQHLSIFHSWKPSITSAKRIICTCGAIGAPGDRCGELTPQITLANGKKKTKCLRFSHLKCFLVNAKNSCFL